MEEVLNFSVGLRKQFWEDVFKTQNSRDMTDRNDYGFYREESYEDNFEKDLLLNWQPEDEEDFESCSDEVISGIHSNEKQMINDRGEIELKMEGKTHDDKSDALCNEDCRECKRIKKGKSMIENLLNEMLETERLYVEALQEVCREYLPKTSSFPLSKTFSRSDSCLKTAKRRKQSKKHSLCSDAPRCETPIENWTDRKLLEATAASLRLVQTPLGLKEIQPEHLFDVEETLEEDEEEGNDEIIKEEDRIDEKSFGLMLGNIKKIKEFHEKVILPGLEEAKDDSSAIRDLFTNQRVCSKLKAEYGKYCIQRQTSWQILVQNKQMLNKLRNEKHLEQDLSSQLQKPVQRILKYHLFLTKLAEHSSKLGLNTMANNYKIANETLKDIQSHTNTMMWVGQAGNIPQGLDLTHQGDMLKDGPVLISGPRRSWGWGSRGMEPAHLILFKQTILLCCIEEKRLEYKLHISMNKACLAVVYESCLFELRHHNKGHHHVSSQDNDKEKSKKNKKDLIVSIGCQNKEERDEWVQVINMELKKLEDFAIQLGNPHI